MGERDILTNLKSKVIITLIDLSHSLKAIRIQIS